MSFCNTIGFDLEWIWFLTSWPDKCGLSKTMIHKLSQWNNKQQLGGSYEDEVFVVHFRGQKEFSSEWFSTTAWDSFWQLAAPLTGTTSETCRSWDGSGGLTTTGKASKVWLQSAGSAASNKEIFYFLTSMQLHVLHLFNTLFCLKHSFKKKI